MSDRVHEGRECLFSKERAFSKFMFSVDNIYLPRVSIAANIHAITESVKIYTFPYKSDQFANISKCT